MSDFIDERFIIFSLSTNSSAQTYKKTSITVDKSIKFTKDQILKKITKLIPNLTSDYFIQFFSHYDGDVIKLRLSFSNCGLGSFNTLIDLTINLSKNIIQPTLSIIEGEKLFKIQTLNKRTLMCKLFCKASLKNFNKMYVAPLQGTLKILKPSLIFQEIDFNEFFQGKSKEKNLVNFIRTTLKDGVQVLKPLLKQVDESIYNELSDKGSQIQQTIKKSFYRYIIKSSIEPSFDISFGSGKYDTMECLTKQEIFYTNSMARHIVTDFSQFQSHNLYITPKIPLQSLKRLYAKEYFSFNDDELSSLKVKIQPPGNRVNLGLQSKYVYNMIQLNQTKPINLRKINIGGFSDINIAEAQFWYLLTVSQKRMAKLEDLKKGNEQIVNEPKLKKQHKKVLVFKSNTYKMTQTSRNRVTHQMKIVSKFKGTPSVFIPQYFKIINQKSVFSKYLIMEHLPHPTLHEYVEIYKNSMSFLTKIHMASSIVQGLQILKNYGIVHMDLKPSNVVIAKRLITKLIDFGQSYNKQVCQGNYKPAFSNPYGCPEVADGVIGKCEFNEKSDVYSWAVVIFQLLFRRLPFFLPLQKTTKLLKQKIYEKYIYYVPEQECVYGSWQIMPLLRCLIFKAMDPNPKNRPWTIWLTVVLKQCLNHMINQQMNSSNG